MRSAVFLDRDGVICRKVAEGSYVRNWSEVEFLPGVFGAVARLNRAGLPVFIVTNQRGVALGCMTAAAVEEIHRCMQSVFNANGALISGVYYCPHDTNPPCNCRKPSPGMLVSAASQHDIALEVSWLVGDSVSDLMAGKAAGCRTIWITDASEAGNCDLADFIARDLPGAAEHILFSKLS